MNKTSVRWFWLYGSLQTSAEELQKLRRMFQSGMCGQVLIGNACGQVATCPYINLAIAFAKGTFAVNSLPP